MVLLVLLVDMRESMHFRCHCRGEGPLAIAAAGLRRHLLGLLGWRLSGDRLAGPHSHPQTYPHHHSHAHAHPHPHPHPQPHPYALSPRRCTPVYSLFLSLLLSLSLSLSLPLSLPLSLSRSTPAHTERPPSVDPPAAAPPPPTYRPTDGGPCRSRLAWGCTLDPQTPLDLPDLPDPQNS